MKVESNDVAATVAISNNNLSNIGSGSGNDGFGVNNFTFRLVNASGNYWGSPDGPAAEGPATGVKVTSTVTICPCLNDVVGTGIAPDCPVKNVEIGESFASIQEAIDHGDTDNSHTITVAARSY